MKRSTKWFLAGSSAVVLIAGAMLLVVWTWDAYFHPSPQKIAFAKPGGRADAVRQDLKVLAQLPSLDRSLTPEHLIKFDRERLDLEKRADEVSPEEFEMAVSRMVALSGNGHTMTIRRSYRMNQVPLRFVWFSEGLFVVRAREQFRALLGSEVVAIAGRPVADVAQSMRPYISGTVDRARALSPMLLQSPSAMNGAGLVPDPRECFYTLKKPSGEVVTVKLAGESLGSRVAYASIARNYSPVQSDEHPGWEGLLDRHASIPFVLRDPDASVFVKSLDEDRGLYVHLSSITGDTRGNLDRQLANLLEPIERGSLRYAVLDLRMNNGGDYFGTVAFTRELPKRIAPDGKLVILIDRATFSAAIVTLARAKYFGGSRAIVMGEHASDGERFWAESGTLLELPNSKIPINYATGYHNWESGCSWADFPRCFWPNYAFDVPAGSLAPSVEVSWRFADYAKGVDTLFEAAMLRVQDKP